MTPSEQQKRNIVRAKLESLSVECMRHASPRAHLVNIRDDLLPYLPADLSIYHGLTITNGSKLLRESKSKPLRISMSTLRLGV